MASRKDLKRNVGLPYAVDKSFFVHIKNMKQELENVHMDSYLAILAKTPHYAGLNEEDRTIAVTGTTFWNTIEDIWSTMHADDSWDDDVDVEEEISAEEMQRLVKFTDGELPEWGEMKTWNEVDKVVMVCCFNHHWATLVLDMRQAMITIYDSNQHKFEDHHLEIRQKTFTPVARFFPQIMKYIGYYEGRPELTPKFTQWSFSYPMSAENLLQQKDSVSCGPLALKYVELQLTGARAEKMNKKDIQKYRAHTAKTIYKFSTDESTLCV